MSTSRLILFHSNCFHHMWRVENKHEGLIWQSCVFSPLDLFLHATSTSHRKPLDCHHPASKISDAKTLPSSHNLFPSYFRGAFPIKLFYLYAKFIDPTIFSQVLHWPHHILLYFIFSFSPDKVVMNFIIIIPLQTSSLLYPIFLNCIYQWKLLFWMKIRKYFILSVIGKPLPDHLIKSKETGFRWAPILKAGELLLLHLLPLSFIPCRSLSVPFIEVASSAPSGGNVSC